MHIARFSDIAAILGTSVSTGQCVEAVKLACKIPPTVAWRRGVQVKNAAMVPPGSAIATFDANGLYGNHTDGTSHAAILLAVSGEGIFVLDQWVVPAKGEQQEKRQPVHLRFLKFDNPSAGFVNDGSNFFAVELA